MLSTIGGRLAFLAAAMLFQSGPQIPPPRGLVNDFANVISPAAAAQIERVAQDVRDKSKGEIAVVTLPDLGGRAPSDVALRIGREWKVGNFAPIGSGDRSRNAGVVILLVPKETSSDGGHCFILTGQGTEGFITDAMSGDICREATPAFRARDYSTGLELVTLRVAQRYAQEFGFTLDTSLATPIVQAPVQRPASSRGGGINPIAYLVILFIVLSLLGGRGRGGCLPFLLGTMVGGGFRGGRGGGWGGGGFGGGGGGGFGGFGGGGGFSGGGGGSNW